MGVMNDRLLSLWAARACAASMTTPDDLFMDDCFSEDYEDEYDLVLNKEAFMKCLEAIAEAESAQNAINAEEGGEVGQVVTIAGLPRPMTAVEMEVTLSHPYSPEFQMEMFLSSAGVFILEECRSSVSAWIDRLMAQLESLRVHLWSVLRSVVREPFVWAARNHRHLQSLRFQFCNVLRALRAFIRKPFVWAARKRD